jgi:hypothetical protein
VRLAAHWSHLVKQATPSQVIDGYCLLR